MIIYLIKVACCSALLLGAYLLFLENGKNHIFKRIYLLLALVLSLTIPLTSFEESVINRQPDVITQVGIAQSITIDSIVVQPASNFNLLYLVYGIYGLISFLITLKTIKNLRKILLRAKHNEKVNGDGHQLILLPSEIEPHSFLNYIFLNEASYLSNKIAPEIILHEQAHVQQQHTLDILFVELLKALCWFNPFLSMYKKAMQTNHEFLADQHVLNTYNDIAAYQHLLFHHANKSDMNSLSSSFNYLTTKKRLIMMNTFPSTRTLIAKHAGLTIAVALIAFTFSGRTVAQQNPQLKPSQVQSTVNGISDKEMANYRTIEKKYLSAGKTGKIWVQKSISAVDELTLKQLFLQMSKSQQAQTTFAFVKPPKPLPVVVPTATQLEQFKVPTDFGVWIDDKKVKNEELENYKPSDFKQVFVSKLYGAAKKGRIYTHQVDLMTTEQYDTYYAESMANKDRLTLVSQSYRKLVNEKSH